MPDFGDIPKPNLKEIGLKTFPEVIVDNLNLYHGSGIEGIKEFKTADEATIGNGVYLTSELEAGKGYSLRRAVAYRSLNPKPTVYEVEINNLRLADLRDEEKTLSTFAQLLKSKLEARLKNDNLSWSQQVGIVQTLGKIRQGEYKHLQDLTLQHQQLTTDTMKTLGYDGLIAIEGGEGEIGNHDTFLIFDPSKVKVLREM